MLVNGRTRALVEYYSALDGFALGFTLFISGIALMWELPVAMVGGGALIVIYQVAKIAWLVRRIRRIERIEKEQQHGQEGRDVQGKAIR